MNTENVQDFILKNPRNLSIAAAVREAWPQARRELIADFCKRLKAALQRKLKGWKTVWDENFFTNRYSGFSIWKWGSCNPTARRIWPNLELAKKPVQCLEYVIAHELAHCIERHHNDRFIAILDKHLPRRTERHTARHLRHPETLSPPSPPADGKDLAQELVRNGLARFYGTRTVLWDGRSSKQYNEARRAEVNDSPALSSASCP